MLQAPLALARNVSAASSPTLLTDAVLKQEVLKSGVFRVESHPSVTVEALAGVHIAAAKATVQQRRQVVPSMPVKDIGKLLHHFGSIHRIIVAGPAHSTDVYPGRTLKALQRGPEADPRAGLDVSPASELRTISGSSGRYAAIRSAAESG